MGKIDPKIALKIAVDIILLLLSGLPVLLFYILGEPFERGFACDDTSIKYPYKPSTVSAVALYLYGTLIPLISIFIIEYIHTFRDSSLAKGARLKVWFWSVYCYAGSLFFGCAMSQLIVDVCKYSVGRLRPHFLDVCKPTNLDICDSDPYGLVQGNPCRVETNPEFIKMQKESRLSFVSGHASFSMFTMIFLVLYLQARLKLTRFPLVRPILQQLCFVIALYTGLSRVMDCKHHWSDVFAGFMNGLIFAVLIGVYVAKLFRKKNCQKNGKKVEDFPMQDNSGNDLFRHA